MSTGSVKNYIELTRAYALGVTFGSCLIIWAFAHYSQNYSITNFILVIVGLSCVHMGANLYDDYIDIKLKLKEGLSLENITFDGFVPKARLIRNGTFSLQQAESVMRTLFINALVIGLYFVYFSGWQILLFMLAGGILTLFYPISPKYGLSEIFIGLIYGPLMIMGGYFALTKSYDLNLLLLSFAVFFSTLVLLHADNIMDWEFDLKNGKKTICILSGSKKAAINVLKLIIFASYAVVVAGVILKMLNPFTLYVFLTLPIATKLIKSINEYVEIKDVEFKPRWYWGMFENWDDIQKNNIAFYMFRFYLARNYVFWFAFFAALGTISAAYPVIFAL